MNGKHTPGPWTYYTAPQPNGCPIIGARGLMVAMLAHSVNYADQRETALANARLIAAAPDMLEALREAASSLQWAANVIKQIPENSAYMENLRDCRAAIAKATGEAP